MYTYVPTSTCLLRDLRVRSQAPRKRRPRSARPGLRPVTAASLCLSCGGTRPQRQTHLPAPLRHVLCAQPTRRTHCCESRGYGVLCADGCGARTACARYAASALRRDSARCRIFLVHGGAPRAAFVGKANSKTCPVSYSRVKTEAECQSLAAIGGKWYGGIANLTSSPPGCFWLTVGDGVFLNTIAQGNAHPNAQLLCAGAPNTRTTITCIDRHSHAHTPAHTRARDAATCIGACRQPCGCDLQGGQRWCLRSALPAVRPLVAPVAAWRTTCTAPCQMQPRVMRGIPCSIHDWRHKQ
jgi:hypothetical protein